MQIWQGISVSSSALLPPYSCDWLLWLVVAVRQEGRQDGNLEPWHELPIAGHHRLSNRCPSTHLSEALTDWLGNALTNYQHCLYFTLLHFTSLHLALSVFPFLTFSGNAHQCWQHSKHVPAMGAVHCRTRKLHFNFVWFKFSRSISSLWP